jgi:hypothetical protein
VGVTTWLISGSVFVGLPDLSHPLRPPT